MTPFAWVLLRALHNLLLHLNVTNDLYMLNHLDDCESKEKTSKLLATLRAAPVATLRDTKDHIRRTQNIAEKNVCAKC